MSVVAAELIARLTADTEPAERELKGFAQKMQGGAGSVFKGNIMASAVQSIGRGLMDVGRIGVGVFADMVSSGADFAAQMDGVTAVLGGTQATADALSNLAIDLAVNPNLKVNATEAAAAIENLATAGLTADEILGGATEATILLANSTGGAFGQAATVATDVMALFNVEAGDMMDAVDGIAAVSNVSKFDLNDYALALSQAGGVAALSGVSFEDFNATIAGTSAYFASGSDAGTSFKTFLQRLNPTTKEAKDLMFELNLLAEDGTSIFYDSAGALKDMDAVVEIMNTTFGDMTETQKSFYLGQLFGTDAMRTAGAVAEMTVDEYNTLKATMADTSALESATLRTDNFKSAWENVQGAIEAVNLKMWQGLEAPAKELAVAVTPLIEWIAPIAVDYAAQLGEWISEKVAEVKATALVTWDFTYGDVTATIMAGLGRLTGAELTYDVNAEVVKVDWFGGKFTYTYDATSRVTYVDFGDAHYVYDAEASVSSLTFGGKTITGDGNDSPIELGVRLFATELPSDTGEGNFMTQLFGDPREAGAEFRQQILDAFGAESFGQVLGEIDFSAMGSSMAATLDQAVADMQARTAEIVLEVKADIAWVRQWMTEAYGIIVDLTPDWVKDWWNDAYAIVVDLIPDWVSDWWNEAYDIVVDLIPNWLGGGGGPSSPPIQGEPDVTYDAPWSGADDNATGNAMFSGGLTWVGERGPELVRLPRNSRIYNDRDSAAMAGGVTVNNYNTLSQPHDIEMLAQRVAAQIGRKAR